MRTTDTAIWMLIEMSLDPDVGEDGSICLWNAAWHLNQERNREPLPLEPGQEKPIQDWNWDNSFDQMTHLKKGVIK